MSQAERVERLEMMAKADQHSGVMGPWSSGERLAVALVLNRHYWLEAMECTMLEAVARLGPDWLEACHSVAKTLHD
jgi:hypothetical protein